MATRGSMDEDEDAWAKVLEVAFRRRMSEVDDDEADAETEAEAREARRRSSVDFDATTRMVQAGKPPRWDRANEKSVVGLCAGGGYARDGTGEAAVTTWSTRAPAGARERSYSHCDGDDDGPFTGFELPGKPAEESKREKRMQANRLSAAKSRMKKMQRVAELERACEAKAASVNALRRSVNELRREYEELRTKNTALKSIVHGDAVVGSDGVPPMFVDAAAPGVDKDAALAFRAFGFIDDSMADLVIGDPSQFDGTAFFASPPTHHRSRADDIRQA
jgi:hypothetical protein